jgi:hypothetical protein
MDVKKGVKTPQKPAVGLQVPLQHAGTAPAPRISTYISFRIHFHLSPSLQVQDVANYGFRSGKMALLSDRAPKVELD